MSDTPLERRCLHEEMNLAEPVIKAPLPKPLGPYKVVEEVGAGGLGRVFRAIDERSGKTVAVKVLHDKFMNNRKLI